MYCPHCRQPNSDRARICEQCGRFLPADSAEVPWKLTGTGGVADGLRIQLAESAAIGRERGSDVMILDAGISRRHARLERSGDSYVISDENSSNGTYVNGHRITGPVPLHPGDVIRVGRSELTIDIGAVPTQFRSATAPAQRANGGAAVEPTTLVRTRARGAGAPSKAEKKSRITPRSCLLLAIAAVALAAVALAALVLVFRSGLFAAAEADLAAPAGGTITLLNATDQVVTVEIEPREGNEGGTQRGLLGQESGEVGELAPGTYRVTFESPADTLNGTCLVDVAANDLYRFLIVPAGVTVTRDGAPEGDGSETGIDVSPLCQSP